MSLTAGRAASWACNPGCVRAITRSSALTASARSTRRSAARGWQVGLSKAGITPVGTARGNHSARLRERDRVGRVERDRTIELLERGGGITLASLDHPELAIEHGAIGGRLQRTLIREARLVQPSGVHRLPCPGNQVLDLAELQH